MGGRPRLCCAGCRRTPAQIGYGGYRSRGQSDEDYVWAEEGTLDRETGAFLCDACYIRYGMPSSREGWKATPANLAALHINPEETS